MKIFDIENKSECNICLQNFKNIIDCKSCEFKTCIKCLQKYLVDNNKCPHCKIIYDNRFLKRYRINRIKKLKRIDTKDVLLIIFTVFFGYFVFISIIIYTSNLPVDNNYNSTSFE